MTLTITGSTFERKSAGRVAARCSSSASDRTGTLVIRDSTLTHNPNAGFHTPGLPGIYFLGARRPTIVRSTLR